MLYTHKKLDQMPRDELIAEIAAWHNKFNARVKEQVEKDTAELKEQLNEKLSEISAIAKDEIIHIAMEISTGLYSWLTSMDKDFLPVKYILKNKIKREMPHSIKYHIDKLQESLLQEGYVISTSTKTHVSLDKK